MNLFLAFAALVAGFVITTFVFKLAGIIKEMVHEGKGFNAKQFYELGREYILCIALICIMPVLLDLWPTKHSRPRRQTRRPWGCSGSA